MQNMPSVVSGDSNFCCLKEMKVNLWFDTLNIYNNPNTFIRLIVMQKYPFITTSVTLQDKIQSLYFCSVFI